MDPQIVPRSASVEKISSSSSSSSDAPIQQWTNEKHLRFLNSMETWFVRTMMENTDRVPRLDRHLPDTEDSTLDSKFSPERPKKHEISVNFVGTRSRVIKRSRRRSPHPYITSQDQVVPQAVKTEAAAN